MNLLRSQAVPVLLAILALAGALTGLQAAHGLSAGADLNIFLSSPISPGGHPHGDCGAHSGDNAHGDCGAHSDDNADGNTDASAGPLLPAFGPGGRTRPSLAAGHHPLIPNIQSLISNIRTLNHHEPTYRLSLPRPGRRPDA